MKYKAMADAIICPPADQADIDAVKIGDNIKGLFGFERMWVEVCDADAVNFYGTLNNIPCNPDAVIEYGDIVAIPKAEVLAVFNINQLNNRG